jgi:transposase
VSVLPANIQDRDGCRGLLREARRRFPFIERIFADAGYQGPKMAKAAAATGCWKLEIVKRSNLHRFVVLPKRWIVERSFAWISRNRRLCRDFERYAATVAAFVRLAMIRLMLKRLTKPSPCS